MSQYQSAAEGRSPRSAMGHYQRLGVSPTASTAEIRKAYRQKSKLYHPDTTSLPAAEASEQFRQLNEAYAVLSNPQQRQRYDRQRCVTAAATGRRPQTVRHRGTHTPVNLDPKQRPLSAGEVFALFLLGITFVGCLALALLLGANRSDAWLRQSPIFMQWQHNWADRRAAVPSLVLPARYRESSAKSQAAPVIQPLPLSTEPPVTSVLPLPLPSEAPALERLAQPEAEPQAKEVLSAEQPQPQSEATWSDIIAPPMLETEPAKY